MAKVISLRLTKVTVSNEDFEPIRHVCMRLGGSKWHPRKGRSLLVENYLSSLASGQDMSNILSELNALKITSKLSEIVTS